MLLYFLDSFPTKLGKPQTIVMNTTPKIWEVASVLVLARHGKAVAAEGRPDAERELTGLGARQANALGVTLRRFGINVVLSSPIKRVMDTMALTSTAISRGLSSYNIAPVPELTCSDDPTDSIQIMWAKLGNVPLNQYFAHKLGEHLKIWGRTALNAVIRELENGGPKQKVLIGGHTLLQNALLWAIGEMLEESEVFGYLAVQTIAHQNILGEGEAFVVRFDDDGRADCEYIRPTL